MGKGLAFGVLIELALASSCGTGGGAPPVNGDAGPSADHPVDVADNPVDGADQAGPRDAAGDGGDDATVPAACTEVTAGAEGWLVIQAAVPGLGSGPMDSPILSCTATGDRFVVTAEGTERDGVDSTTMRLLIDRGFHGPGTYQGTPADGIRADVFHSDVGGFSSGPQTSCTICVGADGRSGTLQCGVLAAWRGTDTLEVRSGSFRCGPLPTPQTGGDLGATCRRAICGAYAPAACSEPSAMCPAAGYCSDDGAGRVRCTRDCTSQACPAGFACDPVVGIPDHVCHAVCGNGTTEAGEACDLPPRPAGDLCSPVCTTCTTLDPGPPRLQASFTIAGASYNVDVQPAPSVVDACQNSNVSLNNGYNVVSAVSCTGSTYVNVAFYAPTTIGTWVYDASILQKSYFCYSRREDVATSDLVMYCAFATEAGPKPGEAATVVVTDLPCGGRGVKGTFTGHLPYFHTVTRATSNYVVDPAHAGEFLDVTGSFNAIRAAPKP